MNVAALLTSAVAATLIAGSALATVTVTVNGTDDIYNAGAPGTVDGTNPTGVDVTGLSSITFSAASGTVYLNLTSGDNLNDPDGGGSAPSSSYNTGANGISGLTAPNAGFITGVFLGATSGATPAALDFSGGTGFTSLAPALQQAFFVGDGLTGDGVGAVQTFYVPTGATTLYLGISDACGYNGYPSCYGDNGGAFSIAVNGASAAPEPASWAMMIAGFGLAGGLMRSSKRGRAGSAWPIGSIN